MICAGCDVRITGPGRLELAIWPSDPDQWPAHTRYFHDGQCLARWLVRGPGQLTLNRAFPIQRPADPRPDGDETMRHVPVRPVG